jgi:NDP-sugar pyrophosphorylase family protein
MHGLILAGGEGSRLSAEGIATPKPLLEIGGEPLVARLLDTLAALGCETLTCMVRADFGAVFHALEGRRFARPLRIEPCLTPSSLHTLVAGLARVGAGPVFCTMVDSVMPAEDWQEVYAASERWLAGGADAVLAVTPYVDDESPLYVRRDPAGTVLELSDYPIVPPLVTGGVYAFGEPARRFAREAAERGVERTRGFLKDLVTRGRRVATVTVSRIIDVDRSADLRLANAWLGSPGARA